MDFKQLRSFVAVVECGSFTRAAERLYTSQPTVSAHIRQLEEELHERLFLRTTKSMEITQRGRELYESAEHVLLLQDKLTERWAQDEAVIRLGVSTIPSAYILPEILPRYREEQPDISFVIHQSDSTAVIAGLLDGRFELGLVGMDASDEGIVSIPFYRDNMVLITPNTDHFRTLQSQNVSVEDMLRREPVLMREEGSGSQKCVNAFFRSVKIDPSTLHITAQLNDQESVKTLVAGGLGLAIVSEISAREDCQNGKLLSFPLPNGTATRSLYLAYRKGDYCRPQTKHFMDFVQTFYQ